MLYHQNQPQHHQISRQDDALNGANAERRANQGTYGAGVSMGSDCGSCKEAQRLPDVGPMCNTALTTPNLISVLSRLSV